MGKKPFDFIEEHRDPVAFLACEDAFQVVHSDVFSVKNMTNEELQQSIVEDILAVTFWEEQTGNKVKFGLDELLRFVEPVKLRERVVLTLKDPAVDVFMKGDLNNLRIKDNTSIRQVAMDKCGVWFSGYEMAEGAMIINREEVQAAVDQHGGVENYAAAINMDIQSTHPTPKKATLQ